MTTSFEDTYFDELRAIEVAINENHQRFPDLTDYQVDKVLEALLRQYTAENRGSNPPEPRLSNEESSMFGQIRSSLDLFLGRESSIPVENVRSMDEVIQCIKRIRKSVKQMQKQGGRQSYLEFLEGFFSG